MLHHARRDGMGVNVHFTMRGLFKALQWPSDGRSVDRLRHILYRLTEGTLNYGVADFGSQAISRRERLIGTRFYRWCSLSILKAWVKSQPLPGRVGTEWRFLIPPNSYETESLVPDVAYLASYFALETDEREYPHAAPDIVVEILSPDDRAIAVAKRLVDPESRIVEAQEPGSPFTAFTERDRVTSPSFPSLALALDEIFAEIDEAP